MTGRWLSKDPIGISGGLNQYVFCGNNPVNFRDPLGLFTRSELVSMRGRYTEKALGAMNRANQRQNELGGIQRAATVSSALGMGSTVIGIAAGGLLAYGSSTVVVGGAASLEVPISSLGATSTIGAGTITANPVVVGNILSGVSTAVGTVSSIWSDLMFDDIFREYQGLINSDTELMRTYFDLARRANDMLQSGDYDQDPCGK